jgi:hypothetical protein
MVPYLGWGCSWLLSGAYVKAKEAKLATIILKASVIGVFVAILGILPPILHFITGPFGPLIGGFIGGTTIKVTPQRAISIGLCMGGLGIFVGVALIFVIQQNLFHDISGILQVLGVSIFIGVYIGLLGGLGAFMACKSVSR